MLLHAGRTVCHGVANPGSLEKFDIIKLIPKSNSIF